MSWLGESRFVLASVAVHVAGGVTLLVLHPRMPQHERKPIYVEVQKREAPRSPSVAEPPRPAREPARDAVRKREPVPSPRPVQAPPPRPSSPTESAQSNPPPERPLTPPPAPPPGGKPTINLFNPSAIQVALDAHGTVAVKPDWGGTTRRAGDGKPEPGTRDPSELKEEAAQRVHEFLGEALSAERIRSGNVAPRWIDAERIAAKNFHPSQALVTDDNSLSGFLHQYLNQTDPRGGLTPRGVDDSRDSGFNGMGYGAGARQETKDSAKTRAIVEVVVSAEGEVMSAKVVQRSGRRKFDQQAMALVRDAVGGKGRLDEPGPMVTRWAVEAWVHVSPPMPGMGIGFDETTGRLSGEYPMQTHVQTSVKLISIIAKR